MEKNEYLATLERVGAVVTDSHIVYTSGKHGSAYVNKDALYPHVAETSYLCRVIAEHFMHSGAQAVIAPAVGGVILSTWTAFGLSMITGKEVLSTYAEKEVVAFLHPDCIGIPGATKQAYAETGKFIIKRGYDKLIAGKKVLVVEDLLTTGGSARKVVEAVRAIGGDVVGLGVLCNRGDVTAEQVGVLRLDALVNVKLDAWDEEDCPLCKRNVPINTDVGHGRYYLAQKGHA